MKRLPSIRGLKSKTIRINPADLAALREELKGNSDLGSSTPKRIG